MKKIDVLQLVKDNQDNIIKDIKDLVKQPSNYDENTISLNAPYGKNIQKTFSLMSEKIKQNDLEVNNIDNVCLEIKLKGESSKRFGIMSHLDTVPVTNNWKTNPYELTRINDKFYGRGSSDDKGPSIMILWALKLYKSLNLIPKYEIVCLFGGDEERGSSDLKHYFSKNPTFDFGFSPDSDFPIIYLEKSYSHYKYEKTYQVENTNIKSDYKINKIAGGTKINVVCDFVNVEVTCKNVKTLQKLVEVCEKEHVVYEINDLNVELSFSGVAAHAKHPNTGVNAIWIFCKMFTNLKLDNNAKDLVKFLNNYFVGDDFGKKLGIYDQDEHSFSTNNLALIHYNQQKAQIEFNYRSTLVTNLDVVNTKLSKIGQLFNFKLQVLEQEKPHYVNKESKNIKILAKAYKQIMGEDVELGVNGGRTYASSCANTVSFGPLFKKDKAKIHSDEESLSLNSIINVTAIYLQLLINISK